MRELVADADVLMSLVASDEAAAILRAADVRLVICPEVESEALYLEAESSGERRPVDLKQLYDDGVAANAALSDAEIDLFVQLAREVDDGEAQALAIASTRQLNLATDDRRAARVAARLNIQTIDTPELTLNWSAGVDTERAPRRHSCCRCRSFHCT